eukprot:2913313-Lingulodinium_polyedra.AAC.1
MPFGKHAVRGITAIKRWRAGNALAWWRVGLTSSAASCLAPSNNRSISRSTASWTPTLPGWCTGGTSAGP